MTEPAPFDRLDTALCFNAYRLNLAFGRFYKSIFAGTGLTYPKYIVLKLLRSQGPMSISALSLQSGAEANTLSPLLKKMATHGAITRERAEDDERRVVISLTDVGHDILSEADTMVARGFDALGLDQKEIETVVRFLDGTRSKLEGVAPKQPLKIE